MIVTHSKIQTQINNKRNVNKNIIDSPANVRLLSIETDIQGNDNHIDTCH